MAKSTIGENCNNAYKSALYPIARHDAPAACDIGHSIMFRAFVRDPITLLLLSLLAGTLCAWLVGWFVYPFGILLLVSATFARLLHLAAIHQDRSEN